MVYIPEFLNLTASKNMTGAKTRLPDYGAAAVDRISNLPVNLIDLILERLPLHDAARTTVLSNTWRNIWVMHPHLVFDNVFFSRLLTKNREEVSTTISNILLVHSGPVLKFHLSVPGDLPLLYTDLWIKNISNSGVRILKIFNNPQTAYRMPSYLFSCSELTHLTLDNCILNPPLRFGGFCNLISVKLLDVIIIANISFGTQLETLDLKYCSGIKYLGCQFKLYNNLWKLMISDSGNIDWRWFECTTKVEILSLLNELPGSGQKIINLDRLVGNMPKIHGLLLDAFSLKCLKAGEYISMRLPTTIMENLIFLKLFRVGFHDGVQVRNVVCLIRSSPNLQNLYIRLEPKTGDGLDSLLAISEQYLQLPNFVDMTLGQLKTVNIRGMVGSSSELHFIKLLLASSPSLIFMKLYKSVTIDDPKEELRILGEVTRLPRASTTAQIIWT